MKKKFASKLISFYIFYLAEEKQAWRCQAEPREAGKIGLVWL